MASYVLRGSNRKPRRLKGDLIIGRTQGSLRFPKDRRISGQHCRLSVGAFGVLIEDLGSSNGTFVNDGRLQPGEKRALIPGDRVTVGDQHLTFEVARESGLTLPLEWLCLGGAALCLAVFFLGGGHGHKRKAGAPIAKKAAEAAPAPDDFAVALGFTEDEFSHLATNYSRLLDSVIIDRSSKEMAASDLQDRMDPQFQRLIAETAKLQPKTDAQRKLAETQIRKTRILHDHMKAMMRFWQSNDVEEFKKSLALMKDYRAVVRAPAQVTDRREDSRSAPETRARALPAESKPVRP